MSNLKIFIHFAGSFALVYPIFALKVHASGQDVAASAISQAACMKRLPYGYLTLRADLARAYTVCTLGKRRGRSKI